MSMIDQTPTTPATDSAKTPADTGGKGRNFPLPAPYPPVLDWFVQFAERTTVPDFGQFIEETNTVAVILLAAKERPQIGHPQHAQRLEKLKKIQDAARLIAESLPELIAAGEVETARPVAYRHGEPFDRVQAELGAALDAARGKLAVERALLAAAQRFAAGEGLFGRVKRQGVEQPWAGQAAFCWELLSSAVSGAGASPPQMSTASENTPLVRVVQAALVWSGFGERPLSTIAKSLRRTAARPAQKRSLAEAAPLAAALSAALGTI